MMTNSARECKGASEMPTQPIAVAYFNRTGPVASDHYLHREECDRFCDRFFLVMVAVSFIASAVLLALALDTFA
jgi:hypothetical protein